MSDSLSLAQLQAQTHVVLVLAALLAAWLGVVLQRSNFCTMGAVSDWVLMGDATRARQWAVAVAVASLGFGLLAFMQGLSPLNTIYNTPRWNWLSQLVGGFLFGIGMVLASGCPSRALVRLAGGNLKSLVVLGGIAVSALATLKGLPAVWRVKGLDPVAGEWSVGPFAAQRLVEWTGWSLPLCVLLCSVLAALVLLAWALSGRPGRWTLLAGAGVGLATAALWWVSGSLGWVAEHPQTLEPVFLATSSGRMESLSFTAPLAYWLDGLLYYSDGSKRLSLGMVLVPGVFLGAWVSAIWRGQWRVEGFKQTDDLARHLVGALLMGFGGVSALGCSIGQGVSGLSTLNVGSLLAWLAMLLGSVSTLRWQLRAMA
jgi:uncharacterized membrane protein YedE/YeeE